MDCQNIEFSAVKSEERINKALQLFPRGLLMAILGFALHLLGVKRKSVAELVSMPEESLKTLLSRVSRDGFPALRDRRQSETTPVISSPSVEQRTTVIVTSHIISPPLDQIISA